MVPDSRFHPAVLGHAARLVPRDITRPVAPVVIEQAIVQYLKQYDGWTSYHRMIYTLSRSIHPHAYCGSGIRRAIFEACGKLLKKKVIFRRKGRIGTRSCCRKSDPRLPDEVRLNANYL